MANLTVRDMTREKYTGRIRDREPCYRGSDTWKFANYTSFISLLGTPIVIGISMLIMYCWTVKQQEKKMMKYGIGNDACPARAGLYCIRQWLG